MDEKRIYIICGLTDYEATDIVGVFDDEQTANNISAEMDALMRKHNEQVAQMAESAEFPEWRYQFPQHERYEVDSYPLNDWDMKAVRRKLRRRYVEGGSE